jgi:hypothetical protein
MSPDRGEVDVEGVGGWEGFGEGMLRGAQYQISRLVALLQPQKLKVASLWLSGLLIRQKESGRDSRRGIEGAQRVFGDAALTNEVSGAPLRFLCQMLPSQILLLPEHVR